MILKEFDENKKAIINPEDLIARMDGFPEIVVSCFARATFQNMVDNYGGVEIFRTTIANLEIPIYKINYEGLDIAIFNSYVGAPGCIGVLEDLIALGGKKFIIFGTCSVLDHDIDDVSIVIPNCAIRDEGTSYHYAPASDEIGVNEETIDDFKKYLDDKNFSYTEGKVWTTDAIYRETVDKMKSRKDSGAIVVDMECSAVSAWAKFREVKVLHFFYAADKLTEEGWDERSLSNHSNKGAKDIIAEIAIGFSKYI